MKNAFITPKNPAFREEFIFTSISTELCRATIAPASATIV